MKTLALAKARACLGKLVEIAQSGEDVCITRRGKPVALLVTAQRYRKPIDAAALRKLTDGMSRQRQSAGVFTRKMRDGDRY